MKNKFDLYKYENNQNKLKKYENKIKLLEELKQDVIKSKEQFQDKCEHDLVLCYDFNLIGGKTAKCLMCDKNFRLYEEKNIEYKNIIDVTPFIEDELQKTFKYGSNILVIRAKEKIKELILYSKNNELDLSKDDVKSILTDDLIKYAELEKVKKLIK